MRLARLTLLFLLLGSCGALHAEPLRPVLSWAGADEALVQLGKSSSSAKQIPLLLQLAQYHLLRSQQFTGAHRYSAGYYSRKAYQLSVAENNISGQIRSQYLLGSTIYHHGDKSRGDSSRARELVQLGLLRSQALNDKALEAEGWYYRAEQYLDTPAGQARKLACYERARNLFQQSGNPVLAIYQLKCIADVHHIQGNHSLALQELQATLAAYQAVHYPRLHYTYDLLAAVSHSMGNEENALRYSLMAIDVARQSGDTTDLGHFYMRVGNLSFELKQEKESRNYLLLAMQNFKSTRDSSFVRIAAFNFVNILIGQKKPREALTFYQRIDKEYWAGDGNARARLYEVQGRCYAALEDYPTAEHSYLLGIKSDPAYRRIPWLYLELVDLYLTSKQYDKARLYLRKARSSFHNTSVQLQAELELRQIDLDFQLV